MLFVKKKYVMRDGESKKAFPLKILLKGVYVWKTFDAKRYEKFIIIYHN